MAISYNNEYALLQLLLRNPALVVDLKKKGFRKKIFRDEKFGEAFQQIYNTFIQFNSIPSAESLRIFGVSILDPKEEIPYTIDYIQNEIKDDYNKRLMMAAMDEASKVLMDKDKGASSALDVIMSANNKSLNLELDKKYSNAEDVSEDIWERYIRRREAKQAGIKGIPLGLDILDDHIGGLGEDYMITIAARNGIGKSWVLAKAVLSAWKQKRNIAIFTCEMTVMDFLQRMHCIDGEINPTRWKKGEATLYEMDKFKEVVEKSKKEYGNLYIADHPGDFDCLTSIIEELNSKNEARPIEAIYIDAAYLIEPEDKDDHVRQKKVANAVKKLATKFKVPVVITVQMNREYAKSNENKAKPTGGGYSIAGSDAYNQLSDVVILLNKNDEIYATFHYLDVFLQKYRHGDDKIPYMIEMNLDRPSIKQIDYNCAQKRILSMQEAPASKVGNKVIGMAAEQMTKQNAFLNEFNAQNQVNVIKLDKNIVESELGE